MTDSEHKHDVENALQKAQDKLLSQSDTIEGIYGEKGFDPSTLEDNFSNINDIEIDGKDWDHRAESILKKWLRISIENKYIFDILSETLRKKNDLYIYISILFSGLAIAVSMLKVIFIENDDAKNVFEISTISIIFATFVTQGIIKSKNYNERLINISQYCILLKNINDIISKELEIPQNKRKNASEFLRSVSETLTSIEVNSPEISPSEKLSAIKEYHAYLVARKKSLDAINQIQPEGFTRSQSLLELEENKFCTHGHTHEEPNSPKAPRAVKIHRRTGSVPIPDPRSIA